MKPSRIVIAATLALWGFVGAGAIGYAYSIVRPNPAIECGMVDEGAGPAVLVKVSDNPTIYETRFVHPMLRRECSWK